MPKKDLANAVGGVTAGLVQGGGRRGMVGAAPMDRGRVRLKVPPKGRAYCAPAATLHENRRVRECRRRPCSRRGVPDRRPEPR